MVQVKNSRVCLLFNTFVSYKNKKSRVLYLIFWQIMIIDYKLPYPSGTATAVLINGFHSTEGDKMTKYGFFFFLLSSSARSEL